MRSLLTIGSVLLSTACLASDPMLIYRAPSLVPQGGAWTSQRTSPEARDLHAAEINARAHRGIEATMRDTMRSIDDAVTVRLGSSHELPLIRRQREVEEQLAGLRQQQRWRRIEADFDRALDWRGLPLGPTTRRVFERSEIELWVRERQNELARDLDAVEGRVEARPKAPALGDVAPREPRIPE